MEDKYSLQTQKSIDALFIKLQVWKNLFFINIKYHVDGWAITLEEKNAYPRRIVIFKPYHKNAYSIKSFEVRQHNGKKEVYEELYFNDIIRNLDDLAREVREIIYGKDLMNMVSKKFQENIL
ncbi:MAG: hypothetical protein GY870_22545 [archaeon]|nr:hypothetical protein [archaeon]